MKSRLIVKCDCGKEWDEENTAENATSWWTVLDALNPDYGTYLEKQGDEKTLEMALRIVWARHSAYREEKGSKKSHEATFTDEITVETLEEADEVKGESQQN